MTGLETLNDDVIIALYALLDVEGISAVRKTCRRLYELSKERIVWLNALQSQVVSNSYPFPRAPVDTLLTSELEAHVIHSIQLASKWRSRQVAPATNMRYLQATTGTTMSDVFFVPGHKQRYLLTVSKGIWSVVTLWDLHADPSPKECAEWSAKGGIINGFTVNSEPRCNAMVAVGIVSDGARRIELLAIDEEAQSLVSVSTILTTMRPVSLFGDIISTSDDASRTVLINWRAGCQVAILQQNTVEDERDYLTYNKCIQVVILSCCILVVSARSLHLFSAPSTEDALSDVVLAPISRHSFGWSDGISVAPVAITTTGEPPPLKLLVRLQSDNPWASDIHTIDLYTLHPNHDPSSSAPYVFPPTLTSQVHSWRGSMRCTDLRLGTRETAVWTVPGRSSRRALIQGFSIVETEDDYLSLYGSAFNGPLRATENGCPISYRLLSNPGNNWTTFDYDEDLGRVALGSSTGQITLIQL